ncbi:centriolar and ciliogenesis-associated protein HYLS1 [Pholidichthys leucotaenia]
MDNLDFSEEEIEEQLAILGYRNIPKHRLVQFKQDLNKLIRRGQYKTLISSTQLRSKSQEETTRPSPPAVTKERGSQFCFKGSSEGIFLHAGNGTQVLTINQNRDYGRQQGAGDSYAQHTVAPKLQLPPSAPTRHHVEPHLEDTLHLSGLTESYTSSPDTQGRCFIKRKVLRKHNGQSLVCDESVYSEDSDGACHLEDQLAELDLSTSAHQDLEVENEDVSDESDAQSSETDDISLSSCESYIRGMTQSHSEGYIRPKPKSFIRPVLSQQTIKKTDPVAKYFHYKQLWGMFRLPGEEDRRSLRWEIRERLAYQPPPAKPRRAYVPNSYIVPTEKKRSALRWEIRNDLANGILPHQFNYQF